MLSDQELSSQSQASVVCQGLTLNPGAKQVGPGSAEETRWRSGAAAGSLPCECQHPGAGSSQLAEAEGWRPGCLGSNSSSVAYWLTLGKET